MGLEKDLPPGEGLVACFRPFIEPDLCAAMSLHVQAKEQ